MSFGSEGMIRSSARNRSYCAQRLRLASCDSNLLRSLDRPITLATFASFSWRTLSFAALWPSPAVDGCNMHRQPGVTCSHPRGGCWTISVSTGFECIPCVSLTMRQISAPSKSYRECGTGLQDTWRLQSALSEPITVKSIVKLMYA